MVTRCDVPGAEAIARTCEARDRAELAPRPPPDDRDPAPPRTVAVLFAVVAILVAIDLATDLGGGSSLFHVLIEGAVIGVAGAASIGFALRVRRLARDARDLRERLATTEAEADRWRTSASSLIAGLADAIDQQLARWGLSPAEADIALLLLKGLSHKEIAEIRGVNETTVRQQARAVYRKAGLSGRTDLAAFFLEDLLAPRGPR